MTRRKGRLIIGVALATSTACPVSVALAGEAPGVFDKVAVALVLAKVPNGIEANNMSYALHEPRLVSVGERLFVVGKPVRDDNKPASEFVGQIGVAWSNVIEFSTFTKEQFAEWAAEKRSATDR